MNFLVIRKFSKPVHENTSSFLEFHEFHEFHVMFIASRIHFTIWFAKVMSTIPIPLHPPLGTGVSCGYGDRLGGNTLYSAQLETLPAVRGDAKEAAVPKVGAPAKAGLTCTQDRTQTLLDSGCSPKPLSVLSPLFPNYEACGLLTVHRCVPAHWDWL